MLFALQLFSYSAAPVRPDIAPGVAGRPKIIVIKHQDQVP
jgi:hypothetical protein